MFSRLFLLTFLHELCKSLPAPPSSSTSQNPSIKRLHITSNIQLRYARTNVEALIQNPDDKAKTAQFTIFIPDSAFISNFSMVTSEGEFVAKVEDKEAATKTYQLAVKENRGAGLLSQEVTRDADIFSVSTNVKPAEKVLFKLTYEELLNRENGLYEHALNIKPGQIVDDLKIEVFINESLPITKLSIPQLIQSNEVDFSKKEEENDLAVVTNPIDGDLRKAHILFQPGVSYQEEAGFQGVNGQLVVRYDVDRNGQDNEVQVLDGYFVHFFVPENLKTIPRHVIFILDVSGSMEGEKLSQLKDAMFIVLDQMSQEDLFNIITFSSGVKPWQGGEIMKATKENKEMAINFVLELNAGGGTNINQALFDGLQIARSALKNEQLLQQMTSMVVFLTDGLATEGTTDRETIKTNIRKANEDLDVSIFCIAFGRDADFNLMKDISQEADSFAKQIYEGSDSALQLEGFYSQISSPLVTNLKFIYVGGSLETSPDTNMTLLDSSLSETDLKTFFQGGQYVIAGKLEEKDATNQMLSVEVSGQVKDGAYDKTIDICLQPTNFDYSNESETHFTTEEDTCIYSPPVYPPRSKDQQFLQKLFAFLNIKQLLEKNDNKSQETALSLALENNFVTPVTSLVVVQPEEEPFIAVEEKEAPFESSPIYAVSAFSYDSYAYDISYSDYAYGLRSYDDYFEEETTMIEESYEMTTLFPNSSYTCSGNITLYSSTYYRGENVTLVARQTPALGEMDNMTVSVKVWGDCCWKLYSEPQMTGRSKLVSSKEKYLGVTSLGDLFRDVSSVEQEPCVK